MNKSRKKERKKAFEMSSTKRHIELMFTDLFLIKNLDTYSQTNEAYMINQMQIEI